MIDRRILLALLTGACLAAAEPHPIAACAVVCDSPAADATGAMHLGNGTIGTSLWVDPAGDLVMYLASTDSFSEACRLLKLGRIRISLVPSPLAVPGTAFRQVLDPATGRFTAELGRTRLEVFAEAGRPVLRVAISSPEPVAVRVSDEGWRRERRVLAADRDLGRDERIWTMRTAPDGVEVAESADVPVEDPDALAWYHRNPDSVVPFTLAHQSCSGLPGTFDPLLGRTFGAWIAGEGLRRADARGLETIAPRREFELRIACPVLVADRAEAWTAEARRLTAEPVAHAADRAAAEASWSAFWARSWIEVAAGKGARTPLPGNAHPLRLGIDSQGRNRFPGSFGRVGVYTRPLAPAEVAALVALPPEIPSPAAPGRAVALAAPAPGTVLADHAGLDLTEGFALEAWIRPERAEPGRILDKITAGSADGFMLDTFPGDSLRLTLGSRVLSLAKVLRPGTWQHVAVSYATLDRTLRIWLDGRPLIDEDGDYALLTRGYQLQRYMLACQGRGGFPVKFNGGIFTVDPGLCDPRIPYNPDWRRWGDCFWWQNTRLPYHPMLMAGDHDLMAPLFAFYERLRPFCEARAKAWYGAEGCYFPETVNIFGAYANADYGWKRDGRKPGEVELSFINRIWVGGLELTGLMLDRYEWTGDQAFAREQLLPMAESVLRWFASRFERGQGGLLVIDPTQALETYQKGVVNDLPCVAGLRSVTTRMLRLPMLSDGQRLLFTELHDACPPIPTEERTLEGRAVRSLAPAERYDPKSSNVENVELYAVWPFRLHGVGLDGLDLARNAYATRRHRFDKGWQADATAAAELGLADEAARGLVARARNSNRAYRFPASWGPNYDWLPDNDHGSNLMTALQHTLLQADGRRILLLPAWPTSWNARFRLHAPQRTVVSGEVRDGRLVSLEVEPASRRADVEVCAPYVAP